MTEQPPSTFPQELQEVLADVTAECWHRMPEVHEAAKRFFYSYADQTVSGVMFPGESREDMVATALIFVFMAGREHGIRGYRTPIPKEVPPSEIHDEIPEDVEDEIERMRDNGEL